METNPFPFRSVPRTGVIYVMTEAAAHGYRSDDPRWCNLGQGQPEIGELEGAPPRVASVEVQEGDQEYAPVAGLMELREAIAEHYNQIYRRGMPSQYSAENVAISSGGRAALTRTVAAVGPVNLGHFLPDYTAYEELLGAFHGFSSIPILLDPERAYDFRCDELRREVLGRGLSLLLVSNPCNPTGKVIGGEELHEWVRMGRELDCTLLLDEFYSHYAWLPGVEPPGITAARYVEDVDRDPVVIFNGLTKNWRYPGWRVGWTLGPKQIIEAVSSAGSFLDGGGNRAIQRAAIPMLSEAYTRAEAGAIQRTFGEKRSFLLERLRRMGITIDRAPDGAFYVWGNLSQLPGELSTDMGFFRAALGRQVITVPGVFFDVNPGKRRRGPRSRFRSHMRFSFGPAIGSLERACDRLEEMIADARG